MQNNQKKYLADLTESVLKYLSAFDSIMQQSSTFERGKNLAALNNWLELQNDEAMRYGLGYGFRKIDNLKRKGDDRKLAI
jgi:hypothetical protein